MVRVGLGLHIHHWDKVYAVLVLSPLSQIIVRVRFGLHILNWDKLQAVLGFNLLLGFGCIRALIRFKLW